MAVTSLTFCGTAASVLRTGTVTAWTNPTNAQGTNDTNVATCALNTNGSYYLVCTNFNFSATIPAGSVIQGIVLTVRASESGTSGSAIYAQLCSNATPTLIGTGKNQSANALSGTTLTDYTLGANNDVWGITPTAATVNSSTFGVAVWMTDTTNTVSIDSVGLTITYQAPYSVTPTVGELSFTGQAPTVFKEFFLNPTVGALTLTGQVPTASITVGVSDRLRISWAALEAPAGDNWNITPTVGALSLTGLAPSVSLPQSISTTTGSLTLTGVAPTVEGGQAAGTSIPTEVGSLVLTGQVPTAVTPLVTNPTAGELAFTGAVPTATVASTERLRISWAAVEAPAGSSWNITPSVGQLTLTGVVPTVTVSSGADTNIPTTVGELVLTGQAPSVSLPLQVTTGVGSLTFEGQAPTPTVSSGADTNVPTTAGSLSLTGYAPTVTVPVLAYPATGSLTLTGYEPNVGVSGSERLRISWAALEVPASSSWTVTTSSGSLTLTGQAPNASTPGFVSPTSGSLVIEGYEPLVQSGNHRLRVSWAALEIPAGTANVVYPASGGLVLTGYAPTVNTFDHVIQTVAGELVFTGSVPTQEYRLPSPDSAELAFTGYEPGVLLARNVTPSSGALSFTGYSPETAITEPPNVNLSTYAGELTIEGHAPTVGASFEITPSTGGIVIEGYAPSVTTPINIDTASGSLSFTGQAPSISNPELRFAYPKSGSLAFGGQSPLTRHGGQWSVTTAAGELLLNTSAPIVVNTSDRPKGGGISKKRRKYKKPYVVEIDGQDFVVESPEEAESLLLAAKETAEEAVEQVYEAPIVEGKPVVRAPRIRVRGDVGPDLTALVEEVAKVRNEIRALYREASRNAEIAYLMRIADDEEAITALWIL